MTDARIDASAQARMAREGHDEDCLACVDPDHWEHDLKDAPGSKPRRMVRVFAGSATR